MPLSNILSVVIVSFKSDKVIDNCIQSIPKNIEIIVVDNSNNKLFKKNLEMKYRNVTCILSKKNLGMGAGNNLGLKHVNSTYALILNPDLIMHKNAINQIIKELKKNITFCILAPISDNVNYPNFKISKQNSHNINKLEMFNVESVDGYAMVLNLKRLNLILHIKENNFFDENFFMYLENDDLCKRVVKKGEKIFVLPKSKVNHFGSKAVDPKYKYEVELSRNWHWVWSKFYYNKKHFGYFFALVSGLPSFLTAFVKYLLYFLIGKKFKRKIYLQRISGFWNALLCRESFYRPNIK
jgi:N-acetylglucosaminyl-diphospho-decaprenol L-rhamnosyltransferase